MSLARALEPDWPFFQRPKDELAFTSVETMLCAATLYLVGVACGTYYMRGKDPIPLKWFSVPYNFTMCFYSLWTFTSSNMCKMEWKWFYF